ncbi:hypothetical protein [Paenibacillus sp. 1P07SE]|uniref:hypothetical protein n=1 Tax=Paenibacillus sp. 1P07SE TaxID=3132209 RepID=UPI0039A621D4
MNNHGQHYIDCIGRGCAAWRRGDDEEGRQWFQQACLLWLAELRQPDREASTDSDGMSAPQAALRTMEQILLLLQREDVAAATDLLEYELLPELRKQFGSDRAETDEEPGGRDR